MAALNRTRPIRVCFERNGEPVRYDVRNSSPMLDLIPCVDVIPQMQRDNIDVDEVKSFMLDWSQSHPEVERVVVWYRAGRYSILILTNTLSKQLIGELQVGAAPVRSLFGQSAALISVLGPEQKESSLFAKASVLASKKRLFAA